ncbi:general transcription factor 3C polypeptide 4-like [Diadema setosum]|uniref:general transcription factor 3C polypeptide 4-like n=1 Tax=Diadema setosum TaxID=31175 RepID=UPI003B3B38CA
MKSDLELVQEAVGIDVLTWSQDNRIAIAAEKSVYVLVQRFTPSLRDELFGLEKEVWDYERHKKPDIGINRKIVDALPSDSFTQHRFVLNGLIDFELNSDPLKVRFSPISHYNKRSLLACLTRAHQLVLCMEEDSNGEGKPLHLMPGLYGYVKMRNFSLTGKPSSDQKLTLTSDFEECQHRMHQLEITGMEWSEAFSGKPLVEQHRTDRPRAKRARKVDGPPLDNIQLYLLAAAMKSGHVVVWKVEYPIQHGDAASVASVIDAGHDWTSALAWHHPLVDTAHPGQSAFLASGGQEGRLSIWQILLTVGQEVIVRKLGDAWEEKDQLQIQAMAWVNALCTSDTFVLAAAKGLYIMVFQFGMREGVLEIRHQSHKVSLHTSLFSVTVLLCNVLLLAGFVCHKNLVYSSSTDGSIQEACIKKENGISVSLSLKEPARILGYKVNGLAISRNGVFLAAVRTHAAPRMTAFRESSRLHYIVAASDEEIEGILLDTTGSLCDKCDCLEWLHRRIMSESVPQDTMDVIMSDQTLEVRGRQDLAYLLGLRRLVCFMLVHRFSQRLLQVYGNKEKGCLETELKEKEESIKCLSERLLTMHVEDCVEHNKLNDKRGRAGTVLGLMSDWLKLHHSKSEEPITARRSVETASRETCRLCGQEIKLTSAYSDTCQNGHSWRRCSLTLQLCQTLRPRRCTFCGTHYAETDPTGTTDPKWLEDILNANCIFCGGTLSAT